MIRKTIYSFIYFYSLQKADFSSFNYSIFHLGDSQTVQNFFHESIDTFIDAVAEWPGYESYVPKLKEFRKTFYETGKHIYSPAIHNVLNHGDFHIKNLVGTKLDNGLIDDFYMVIMIIHISCVCLWPLQL